MKRSWTARLATTIVASQLFLPTTVAQGIATSLVAGEPSVLPTAITARPSSSASTPTPSSKPKVHTITAGAGGFKFTPQEISNVSVGDIVTWEFFPPDHSVARAEFGSACVPYEDTGKDKVGFWSGTQWVNNTKELTYFNVTINSTEPIFFYCAAPKSCTEQHMVGVINPNSTQTLASQVHAAAQADFQIEPGQPIPPEASSTLSNPSTPSSTSAPHNGSSGGGSHALSTGAIVGIAVGGAAFLILCAALFFFVGRSKTLKETIRRQDATNNTHDPHMSQQYGSNYGDGGLASPGFQQGHADYRFGSPPPPQYGQHSVGEQYPSGWTSPGPHHGHLSTMSGMSQQQLDQIKHAQMNTQPVVAELNSPPMGQQGFSAELEAPNQDKTGR
ncbi:hypothetical protein P3342_010096 [Pyrenophora teres f. teres]|uniref:Extracellular serine-rich protein n=2 Tax=Pyrenophora teres f. teres TaxID=97479 RepID=E3RX10_PYRTT|nr:hypothetical protein PTT_13888 [Pyrenophora teres f. teres 0-1]KAE8825257.1 hypothetical protein HRS9139_08367 [Pyrenophora teres f. teres]CAA9963590.1 hypothetical protein PTMSG1_06952 [Pyrenophora teres f. maculata]KAE8834351.1 hypothetical protein PTNB85_05684 [Pyrenophora teres f. teres]KAE8860639.1 hypothetical protein PTNB29_05734 [Pyrenophora teres f. teres]